MRIPGFLYRHIGYRGFSEYKSHTLKYWLKPRREEVKMRFSPARGGYGLTSGIQVRSSLNSLGNILH